MPIYEVADGKVHGQAQKIMKQHHGTLAKAGVSMEILFARANRNDAGEPIGAPLKAGGVEVPFVARIVGLKDRTKGMKDIEIVLNGDTWDAETDDHEGKQARLDQALCTFMLLESEAEGEALLDKLGRPRLRRRYPDYALGWYPAVAARWGEAAPSVRVLRAIEKDTKQMSFKFTQPEQEKLSRRAEKATAEEASALQ